MLDEECNLGMRQFPFQIHRYPFMERAFSYDQTFGRYPVQILEQRLVVYECFWQTNPILFFEPEVSGLRFQAYSILPILK